MRIIVKKTFLHVCWLLGLFHVSRYLMKDKLQILCYHGFETSDESSFRPNLFIKKETFARRLALISKYGFPVLPLNDALDKLQHNNLPKNAVVITIDDGFDNVLNVSSDILQAYKYPATLYLTTYYAQKESPIFRLVVQYMFWKTNKQLVNFGDCVWNKHSDMNIDLSADGECDRVMWVCINYGENECSEPERISICQQLGALLGVDYKVLSDSRILSLITMDEVKILINKGFDVQLHTHRHSFPTDDESTAKKEIVDNRDVIGQVVNYPTKHFCYPSGVWSKTQWPWLERLGVESATTCLPGLNDSNTPMLALTRFLDGENISDIEFKAELFGFLELMRMLKKRMRTV